MNDHEITSQPDCFSDGINVRNKCRHYPVPLHPDLHIYNYHIRHSPLKLRVIFQYFSNHFFDFHLDLPISLTFYCSDNNAFYQIFLDKRIHGQNRQDSDKRHGHSHSCAGSSTEPVPKSAAVELLFSA